MSSQIQVVFIYIRKASKDRKNVKMKKKLY